MKLSGPDFFEWMGVRRGGLARWEGHYYDHGNPVPGWLIPDIVEGLLKDGLLELGDPDKSGIPRVALTEAGLAHYRVLCKRQRRKDLVAPPPSTATLPRPPRPRPVAGWTSGSSDEPQEAVTSSERFYVVILSGGWRHARRVT